MARLLRLVGVLAAALIFPASALAGTLTLHPSGFGTHSFSAWKAHEGLPDTQGGDDQALYFQKDVPTTTVAAGVAVFKGFAQHPLPVNELTGLSFWVGTDGHCGAGAPRFNIVIQPTGGGPTQRFFLGCQAMAPGPTATAPNGRTFQKRSAAAPFPTAFPGPLPSSGFNVVGLSIVFDEGNEAPICGPDPTNSCVFLDDIEVQTSNSTVGTQCWTGANDNSNTSAGPCPTPTTNSTASIAANLAAPTGIALDATDIDLVTALTFAYPGVPLTSWVLYPNVIY